MVIIFCMLISWSTLNQNETHLIHRIAAFILIEACCMSDMCTSDCFESHRTAMPAGFNGGTVVL